MPHPISSFLQALFALFLLISNFEKNDAFHLPKASNGTDDGPNLKIVNGHYGNYRQFPFIAEIGTRDWGSCGASIVNAHWVITAAHCVKGNPSGEVVRVGVNSLDDPNTSSRTYPVSRIFSYPGFQQTSGTPIGDLALLMLAQPIQFTDGVTAACLDYGEQVRDQLYIAGYGSTSIRYTKGPRSGWETVYSEKGGNRLKYAFVKEARDADFCDKGMDNVCVLPLENQYDSGCFGDSGSPLISSDARSILGVFNYVDATYEPNSGLYAFCFQGMAYTRLSRFRNFIDQHVGAGNYCKIE